jgi:hypothetical protein
MIELAIAFAAVFGAAWLLGYNSGKKTWHAKFVTLGELSLKLIQLIEKEAAERETRTEEIK